MTVQNKWHVYMPPYQLLTNFRRACKTISGIRSTICAFSSEFRLSGMRSTLLGWPQLQERERGGHFNMLVKFFSKTCWDPEYRVWANSKLDTRKDTHICGFPLWRLSLAEVRIDVGMNLLCTSSHLVVRQRALGKPTSWVSTGCHPMVWEHQLYDPLSHNEIVLGNTDRPIC